MKKRSLAIPRSCGFPCKHSEPRQCWDWVVANVWRGKPCLCGSPTLHRACFRARGEAQQARDVAYYRGIGWAVVGADNLPLGMGGKT